MCAMPSSPLVHDHEVAARGPALAAGAPPALERLLVERLEERGAVDVDVADGDTRVHVLGAGPRPGRRRAAPRCRSAAAAVPLPRPVPPAAALLRPRPPGAGAASSGHRRRRHPRPARPDRSGPRRPRARAGCRRCAASARPGDGRGTAVADLGAPSRTGRPASFAGVVAEVFTRQPAIGGLVGPVLAGRTIGRASDRRRRRPPGVGRRDAPAGFFRPRPPREPRRRRFFGAVGSPAVRRPAAGRCRSPVRRVHPTAASRRSGALGAAGTFGSPRYPVPDWAAR